MKKLIFLLLFSILYIDCNGQIKRKKRKKDYHLCGKIELQRPFYIGKDAIITGFAYKLSMIMNFNARKKSQLSTGSEFTGIHHVDDIFIKYIGISFLWRQFFNKKRTKFNAALGFTPVFIFYNEDALDRFNDPVTNKNIYLVTNLAYKRNNRVNIGFSLQTSLLKMRKLNNFIAIHPGLFVNYGLF